MSHRANAPGIIFGIVFGLFLVDASPGAAAPRDGPPLRVEVSSLEELRQALERATPGSVIRLASGTYQIFTEDPSFVPVANDFSNLAEKLDWCHSHDDECRNIARRARQHAESVYRFNSAVQRRPRAAHGQPGNDWASDELVLQHGFAAPQALEVFQ